jgi:outer membrane protein insertion porin family
LGTTSRPAGAQDAPVDAGRAPAFRVLVAVLPFDVHSAQPLGELDENVAAVLRALLESSGRVDVLDTVLVRETLIEHVAGESSAMLLQRRAAELGADWIVEGSLTELAGRFSLDVRVVPVSSPVPARTMVFTADGEEELLGRINDLSERVLQIIVGERGLGSVTAVNLIGIEGFNEAAMLALLETQEGDPFDGEAVQRDLEALRDTQGVGVATVETDRSTDGVAVTYRLVPVERFGGTSTDAAGDLVAEIRIEGNRRIEADAIRARIDTEIGDEFSAPRLAEDVRAVNNLGFFKDLRVYSESSENGRVLTFRVEENPVVRQITIAGNEALEAEKIREQLTLTTGSTLDLPLLIENRQRVEMLYQAEGYHLADVGYEIEALPNDAVAVHFEVEEGNKLRLREIRFEGNKHFTDRELAADLQIKPWRFYHHISQFIQKGAGVYAEPLFAQDLQTVEKKYADAGYIRAEVGDPDVDPTPAGLVVTVSITEGDRFRTGKLDVSGDATLSIDDVRDVLALSEDDWFSRSGLTEDVDRVEFRYTNQGFYQAEVNPITDIHESTRTVDVVFEIEKGPLYFVRQIDVLGNTRTIDRVLRREINIVEGELYSARSLAISKRRLQNLGYFDEVNFEPRPTDQSDQVDLDVKVAEKPTGSLSFGAGFSSQDSFILSANVSQNNLLGRGYGVSFSADWGGNRKRLFGTLTNPRLLDSEIGLSVSLFNTELSFDDFEEKNLGTDLTLSRALDHSTNARGFLRYGFSSREIEVDSSFSGASPVLRQFEQDATGTSRLSLIFSQDTRNEPVLPSRGHTIQVQGTYAGLGGFTKYLRLETRGSYYTRPPRWVPLPRRERSTLTFSGGVGLTNPLNSLDDFDLSGPERCLNGNVCPLEQIDRDVKLPLTDRYFMGGIGALQLRGFKARSLGPRRSELNETNPGGFTPGVPQGLYTPLGRNLFGQCVSESGVCNDLSDKDIDDFDDLDDTTVIGGSKFISFSTEYRFPVSEAIGLVGILFFDAGNAFAEDDTMFDLDEWRYATGVGALWFSPFGPLEVFWGLPLDPYDDEQTSVFEFNVGGGR